MLWKRTTFAESSLHFSEVIPGRLLLSGQYLGFLSAFGLPHCRSINEGSGQTTNRRSSYCRTRPVVAIENTCRSRADTCEAQEETAGESRPRFTIV